MRTKGDLVNNAYSQARISGLTSQPTPEDLTLTLNRLEGMAAEFKGRNICVNYNFEDTPDLNSPHNMEKEHEFAFETNLAIRLLADFGKAPIPSLVTQQQAGFSFLSSSTAPRRQTQYPSRQPVGSGNDLRYYRYQKFYRPQSEAPLTCETNKMFIGDIDIFVEHFDAYLSDGETIDSYTIESDSGLTLSADSLTTPDITYTVEAVGNNEGIGNSLLEIKIVATTNLGRVTTRIINFELTSSDI